MSRDLIEKLEEKPARSRHCSSEQIRIFVTGGSLGKARRSDELEPGELPV